jgi:hypothetical protein
MTKYILLTLGSFGYFIYKLLISVIYAGHVVPKPEYINLTAPILLSISAGLFITQKTKGAGIFGLLGLAIASKDILSNWLIIDQMMQSKYVIQFFVFVILTTTYLFFLGFISVKAILNADNSDRFEIIKYQPNGTTAKVIGIIPTVIIVIATVSWLTLA